jgi:hypothetical protein
MGGRGQETNVEEGKVQCAARGERNAQHGVSGEDDTQRDTGAYDIRPSATLI